MLRKILLGLLAFACIATLPLSASAGGFEYPAVGTQSLGRGGAFYARADDPTATLYNPANLALLSGTQLSLNAHIGLLDACYQRSTRADGSVGGYQDVPSAGFNASEFDATPDDPTTIGDWTAGKSWPEVCNDGPPAPNPVLAYAQRLTSDLGIGFGIFAPAAAGHLIFGDAETGTVENGTLPAPNRYVLLEQELLILQPTLGVGYAITPQLRVGLSAQWGLGIFKFTNYTVPFGGDEDPAVDIRSDLEAQDWFIPGLIAGISYSPIDNLDVAASVHWVQDIEADGKVTLTTGAHGAGDMAAGIQSTVPRANVIDGATLETPQVTRFALGFRYADRIAARPEDPSAVSELSGRVEDSMSNERWDVELDVTYEMSSAVEEFVVNMPADQADRTIFIDSVGIGGLTSTPVPLPAAIHIPHQWKDQLSVRLGGDYNIIPGMAAIRAGVSYETAGQDPAYQNLDFFLAQRYGAHVGASVRLGSFDVHLAYAHFFQDTVTTKYNPTDPSGTDEAQLRQINPEEDKGTYINAGKYESSLDVFSLGLTWHI